MPKTHKHKKEKNKNISINNLLKILFFVFVILICVLGYNYLSKNTNTNLLSKITKPNDVNLKLLFTGDIFLDRHIDELTQKDNKTNASKYSYPFSGLSTLHKENYDAWIGNLECPVTTAQSTSYEKENYLKFSCKPEYMNQLAKYFDVLSLANNHTNNMDGEKGIEETRKHLDDAGIKYFGDFDNSKTENVCKIVFINSKESNSKIPIALCGFHGVFALPTPDELSVIKKYSKYFVTIIMPHQGVEYASKSNSYQQKIYKQMIDGGADAVFGSHPHVIEEVEQYKGKIIFYSLGNFIFDQAWSKTREHMEVETQISFANYESSYKNLESLCNGISSLDCLREAEDLKIAKPEFEIKFLPIFTIAGNDFVTKKWDMPETDYQMILKNIGFDKIATSSKIN